MEQVRFNYSKLKGRIVELGLNYSKTSDQMGLSLKSFSSKINGDTDFRQSEINKLLYILDIPWDEVGDYFFDTKVK